jgi:lipoprotein-releasing system permease protein
MLTWWIAFRYLKAKRKQKFISLITWISILGIVVGVMALITVISVMSGFDRELTQKIIGISPHVVVEKESGIDNYKALMEKIIQEPNVKAVSPLIEGPVLISSKYTTVAIVLRGIDMERERRVTSIEAYITKGPPSLKENKIILGEELARRLGVAIGDKVKTKPSEKLYEVSALFKCGMYEYDATLGYVSLKKAQELFSLGPKVHALGIKVDDYYKANAVSQSLRKSLGPLYGVRSWIEARANLFTALKMEKTVMFVVVALVIVVGAFNIASTLIMIVMEKTKDIAILKTIGTSSGHVMAIFMCIGSMLGIVGTGIGVAAGIRLARALDGILNFLNKTFGIELFSPKVYYLDKLPVFINPRDVITITLCALIISILATVYPAWTAARLRPVEALRYE